MVDSSKPHYDGSSAGKGLGPRSPTHGHTGPWLPAHGHTVHVISVDDSYAVYQQRRQQNKAKFISCWSRDIRNKQESDRPIVVINFDNEKTHLKELPKTSAYVVYMEYNHVYRCYPGTEEDHVLSDFVKCMVANLQKDIWIFVEDSVDERSSHTVEAIDKLAVIRHHTMLQSKLPLSSFPIQIVVTSKSTASVRNAILQHDCIKCISIRPQTTKNVALCLDTHYNNRKRKMRNVLAIPDIGSFCEITVELLLDNRDGPTPDELPYIEDAYIALREHIEDPSGVLRQQMHHWFKIPNVRVARILKQDPGEDGNTKMQMVVELRPLDMGGFDVMVEQIHGGSLRTTIQENLRVHREAFSGFTRLQIDEDQLSKTRKFLEEEPGVYDQAWGTATEHTPRNEMFLVRTVVTMFYKHHLEDSAKLPGDFLRLLRQQGCIQSFNKIKSKEGRNAMHMAIVANRPDFLKLILYMNKWGILREEVILATTDSRPSTKHVGFTPRRLAEALAFTTKGQILLEEYDHLEEMYLGLTPFNKACLSGSFDIVKILAEAEPSVLVEHSGSLPAMLCASGAGHYDIVDYLCQKDVSVDYAANGQDSCIAVASMFGNSEVFAILAKHLVDLTGRKNADGHNAIDYCVMNGDLDSLRVFKKKKFTIEAKTLRLAVKYSRNTILTYLLDECKLDVNSGADHDGWTAVHQAIVTGELQTLQILLQYRADFTGLDRFGKNVFHLVAEYNKEDILHKMILVAKDSGQLMAMINARDYYTGKDVYYLIRGRDRGRRAWHWIKLRRMHLKLFQDALAQGQLDVAQHGTVLYSGFGAGPDQATNDKIKAFQETALERENRKPDMTALHHAANKEHMGIVKVLLQNGADPNTQDCFGATPGHHAAMRGNLEVLRVLVENAAKLDIRTEDGQSLADIAEENGHRHIMNYLEGDLTIESSKTFLQRAFERIQTELSTDLLVERRAKGLDVRRHLIAALRELSIDINTFLLELGSGPVLEASSDA